MSMITSASPSDVTQTRSSERCYEVLRKMLICAQIPPGTRLGEVEWAAKLGLQRAALREALVLLVHDGLLLRRSSGGFFTPRLDEIDVDHVVDARAVLELGALKITCSRKLPDSAFEAVEAACQVMQHCHDAGLTSGFAESDFLFHQKLLELSGNPTLIKMFSHSAQLIFVMAAVTEDVRRRNEKETIQQHRSILTSVRQGKMADAVSQLEAHLMKTKQGIQAAFSRM